MTELAEWHERLLAHFTELAAARPAEHFVFALEHGLDSASCEQLAADLRAHVRTRHPERRSWLPLVVYASELGYRYVGWEYWQTFESSTPGWLYGEREYVREGFRKFCDEFRGFRPSGAWAHNFPIISWPIAHAILPVDLQHQLAQALYQLRYRIEAEHLASPEDLATLLLGASWQYPSRFQNLAQDTTLLGYIATALLEENHAQSRLILPATLQRIVGDLNQVRQAREWLGSARQAARRARLKGLRPGLRSRRATDDDASEEVALLAVEPRVLLRPRGDMPWDVFLEFPNLSPLADAVPELADALSNSRCTVTGTTGPPLPRGYFLYGRQTVRLESWPQRGTILVKFERSTPHLDFLLSTECLLRPGDAWLLAYGGDGRAREVRTRVVRPGKSYVLLSDLADQLGDFGVPVMTSCDGVSARTFDVPDVLTDDVHQQLINLGLNVSRTLSVWPAGLPPAEWDGEGTLGLIAGETCVIGICTDHEVESLLLGLDGMSRVSHPVELDPGVPVFTELPEMSVGAHRIYVLLRSGGTEPKESHGHLECVVREARAWTGSLGLQGALVVIPDPATPTLNEFWEGQFQCSVRGPEGASVTVRFSLHERHSSTPLVRREFSLSLPADAPRVGRAFAESIYQSLEVQGAYDVAALGKLEIDGRSLGKFSLDLEREFEPLRLVPHRERSRIDYSLRVVSDAEGDFSMQFSAPSRPDQAQSIDATAYREGFVPSPDGGLYLVFTPQGDSTAIVLPPTIENLSDLGALRPTPTLRARTRSLDSVNELIWWIEKWSGARLPGDLFAVQLRTHVQKALVQQLVALVAGERWLRSEQRYGPSSRDERALRELSAAVGAGEGDQGVGEGIVRKLSDLVERPLDRRVVLALTLCRPLLVGSSISGVSTWGPQELDWFMEFALRFASSPELARAWAKGEWDNAVRDLFGVPIFLRAARFVVLGVSEGTELGRFGVIYPGWEWN